MVIVKVIFFHHKVFLDIQFATIAEIVEEPPKKKLLIMIFQKKMIFQTLLNVK